MWRDVEGLPVQLWGCSVLGPRGWRGAALGLRVNKGACPAKVRDPQPSLVGLVEAEPPDPCVEDVIWGSLPRGEEYPKLRQVDGGGAVWQGNHGKAPLLVNALEVLLKGTQHVV